MRRATTKSAEQDAAIKLTLGALVGSRLLVWFGALGALAIFGRPVIEFLGNDPLRLTEPFRASWANFVFAPAARWDSVWYLSIAHFGYSSRASSGFFPLYPLLIRLGAGVFGSELVVGTLISLGSMMIALYILYLLTRLEMSEETARTTVLLLAFFPTAFFLSAVYTESLFLLLSVGAVYLARQDRWGLASLLAGLAAATRVNGALLAVPLALMYLYGPRRSAPPGGEREWWRPRYRPSRSMWWLLLVPAGLLAYLGYLWITHDAPLAPFQVQAQYWSHEFVGPFGAIVTLALRLPHDVRALLTHHVVPIGPGDPISWNAHDLIDVPFLAFGLAGLILSWRRVPLSYFVYGLIYLGYALSSPTSHEALASFPRYVLVAFPLFMGWGGWLADRPAARRITLASSAVLLVVFSGLWGVWAWVA
jgi:Mannosyltransferase (PIG-V)